MYETKISFSPVTMKQIFSDRNYNGPNIRSQIDFELPHVNSVKWQDTLRFLGPKIWNIIPRTIKEASSLPSLRIKSRIGQQKTVHADYVKVMYGDWDM